MKSRKPNLHEGGCLCGRIRFTATGMPQLPHTRSCKKCQRHSGALTVAWVEFPRESVFWNGPGGAPSVYRSSDFSSRAFCPECGSTTGAIDDKPVIALVLGVFDSPNRQELIPISHSYKGGRPKWWHVELG
ncbi:MAG: GFA family protein [Aestuariivirga sp.]